MSALEASAMSGSAMIDDDAPGNGAKPNWRSYYSNSSQWMKVGAAAVGGATLMVITAGLAAPAIVAGIGTAVGMAGGVGTQCLPLLEEWHVIPISSSISF